MQAAPLALQVEQTNRRNGLPTIGAAACICRGSYDRVALMVENMSEPALSFADQRPAIVASDFRMVAESEDHAVIDKPPFLLMHPTKPDGKRTLWGELRELFAFEIANGGQVSIVNRLDRETSGLVLVAKTASAARRFGLLMQEQRLAKEYVAIVWGWPEWDKHVVDAPLDRLGKHKPSPIWLKQSVHANGSPAFTEFRVEDRFLKTTTAGDRFSVIRATPRTGRTHQIRVHLASIGHPVVGDKIYGPQEQLYLRFIKTGWTGELQRQLLLPRHALHSSKLAIAGEVEWISKLPADLENFVEGN